ncbi:MAG: dephospho-CoA kinase [Chloroflexota bacterium]
MAAETYVLGLVGAIATGKSTVARMLATLGAEVLDADRLAHATMAPGAPAHWPIVARFGAGILDPCGQIDRARLGAIVFADVHALADLEAIVHPLVVSETLARIGACQQPVCVIEAIKLYEAGLHRHCQAVWAVTCRRAQQAQRLMAERGLTRAQAELRIRAQAPASAWRHLATRVIENSADLEATWRQVCAAWNAIPGLAPRAPEVTWASMAEESAS